MSDWNCWMLVGLVTVGALAGLLGCRPSNRPELRPVFPVRGSIFVGGKPAAGAVVSFHPLGDPSPQALRANGRVGDDGTFSLTTYFTADGAAEGEFVVTVYWADPAKSPQQEGDQSDVAPDLLQGRFAARESSTLRAKVANQAIEFAPVELRAPDVVTSREYHLRAK